MTGPVFSLLLLLASPQAPTPGPSAPAVANAPTQADIDRLEAEVFALEVRRVSAEQQLGQEMAKRAAYEMEALKAKANTLRPSVRALVGLPVSEKPPGAAPPPSPASKESAPPKD